jgi:hypothetical protein
MMLIAGGLQVMTTLEPLTYNRGQTSKNLSHNSDGAII